MNAWNSTTTDAALLRRYVETHNEEAFAELVHRRLALVYSAALRRLDGHSALAEDVSQSVFIELVRKADTLVNHPALAGWLYTASCRIAADQSRRQTRHQHREHAMATPPEPIPESLFEWNQIRPVLDEAMLDLTEADRQAVLLRFFEQRPFRAIGEELGLGEDAVRMRVTRALDRLRDRLATRGIKSAAAALGSGLMAQTLTSPPAQLESSVVTAALAVAPGPVAGLATAWMDGWLPHTKLAMLTVSLLAALGLAVREWNRTPQVRTEAGTRSETPRFATVSTGPARQVMTAGRAKTSTSAQTQSLAKLRSALFDTQLSPQERHALLKESSGELVGFEKDTLPLFRKALRSADPNVVAMAVEASGHFGALPKELHSDLMHVFLTTDSAELAGLTANRLSFGPEHAEEFTELVQLLRERPVLREALSWLIPEAASQSANLEANRQFLEGLRSDDQPEVRQAAQKILGRLPRPAPSQSKVIEQAMANMQESNPAIQVLGLSSVRLVAEATPELVAVIRNLARSGQEPEVRLAANQALRRLHISDETDGVESVEFYREIAEGRATVPDLLAALSGSLEAVLPSITALSAMGGQYWKTHLEHRESASRTLRTLLQDPDPVRVEAAASALKRIQPELPKSIYTLRELEPLFLAMQDWLTPGEYAIAMRDFQSSAESMWQVFGYGDTPPTHVWRNLVEVLPVGPMHENRPAYEAMVKALKGIDPSLQPPVPEN